MKSNDLAFAKLKDFSSNVSGLTINEAKVFFQRAHHCFQDKKTVDCGTAKSSSY